MSRPTLRPFLILSIAVLFLLPALSPRPKEVAAGFAGPAGLATQSTAAPMSELGILSAGQFNNCALKPGGAVDCWGATVTDAGQAVDQPGPYTQVSTRWLHTCALTPGGAAECWGFNDVGQAEGQTGPYTQVSVGNYHTCALMLDGKVDCWGKNHEDQAEDRLGPYTQISAGGNFNCALTPAGGVECWGAVNEGHSKPSPYIQVSAAVIHWCALAADGSIDCWGTNDNGQVQNKVGPYTQVSTGTGTTCALNQDAAVECWGVVDPITPQDGPYSVLDLGGSHACALTPAGKADCWGSDSNGQAADNDGPFGLYAPTPNLTIVKQLEGVQSDFAWAFEFESAELGGFELSFLFPSITHTDLVPGDYFMNEIAQPGFEASAVCDNGDSSENNTLAVTLDDVDVTCIYTNTAHPGSLTIEKQVQGINSPWAFEFTGDFEQFFLSDSTPSMTFSDLAPGDYTINETIDNGVGVSVSCDSGESGGATVTVYIAPEENVTCTFLNTTDPASLTFIKEVTGVDPAFAWAFNFGGDLGEFTLTEAEPQVTFSGLAWGDYTISESVIPGYEVWAECDNGDISVDGELFVILEGNDDVICTFTNAAQSAELTVVKEVDGIDSPWSYEFTGDFGSFSLTNAKPSKTFEIAAGQYLLSETETEGVAATVDCDNGVSSGHEVFLSLVPGEHLTCTFTNTGDLHPFKVKIPVVMR